jgi:hypothetical protein
LSNPFKDYFTWKVIFIEFRGSDWQILISPADWSCWADDSRTIVLSMTNQFFTWKRKMDSKLLPLNRLIFNWNRRKSSFESKNNKISQYRNFILLNKIILSLSLNKWLTIVLIYYRFDNPGYRLIIKMDVLFILQKSLKIMKNHG